MVFFELKTAAPAIKAGCAVRGRRVGALEKKGPSLRLTQAAPLARRWEVRGGAPGRAPGRAGRVAEALL